MPIQRRLPANVKKASTRSYRSARNVKFVQKEAKGHTSAFDEVLKAATPVSSNQIEDPYSIALSSGFLATGGIIPIEPSFNFYSLARLVQQSNVLRQCIESYVTNIEKTGSVLEYVGPEGQEKGTAQIAEKAVLESFLAFCSPTFSLQEIRERARTDLETLGVCFFEVSRNQKGEFVLFDHIPGTTMRRSRRDTEPTNVVVEVPDPTNPSRFIRKTASRHFARFVQMANTTSGTYKSVYFKEFGDPRPIDPSDGKVNSSLAIEDQATEVIMLSIYTPGNIYGLPRWIGQLPAILGSRESEMVNLNFFRENAIPAMAVLISGGALTEESFKIIDDYINSLRGQKAMQRILVLEASGDDVSGSTDHSVSAPRIDMKPMISERQQDGLFKDYDTANQEKIRSSFRLPPIYLGRAQDYTRASAIASMQTAEDQIFGPERRGFDALINDKILKGFHPQYWRYKSLSISLSDPDSLSSMINTLSNAGGMTPNIVIKIANRLLNASIEPITEAWGDYPFPVIMAYVKQGMEIKGLSKFIVDIGAFNAQNNNNQNSPVAKNDNEPPAELIKQQVRDTLRKELSLIADDLREELVAAVQVPAPAN